MQRLRTAERAVAALLAVSVFCAFSEIPASLLAQAAGAAADDPQARAGRLAHDATRHFDRIMPRLGLPVPQTTETRVAQSDHAKPPSATAPSSESNSAMAPVWRWLENSSASYKRVIVKPLTSGAPGEGLARSTTSPETTTSSPTTRPEQSVGILDRVQSDIRGWFDRANSNYASTIVGALSQTGAAAIATPQPTAKPEASRAQSAARSPKEVMESLADTVAKAQREKREADGRLLVELAERTKREREERAAAGTQATKSPPDGEIRKAPDHRAEGQRPAEEERRKEEAARRVAEAAQAEAKRRNAEQAKRDSDRRQREQEEAARRAEIERRRAAEAKKEQTEAARQKEEAARRVAAAAKAEAEKRAAELARRNAEHRQREEAASKAEAERRRDAELERQVAEAARHSQDRQLASAGSEGVTSRTREPERTATASVVRSKLISQPIALAKAPVITIHATARTKRVAHSSIKRSWRAAKRRAKRLRHASYRHYHEKRWHHRRHWRQEDYRHHRKNHHHRKKWRRICRDDD